MADIDVAPLGAADESRDHHALDQQVRGEEQEVAILERARFAFVAVADNIFHVSRGVADRDPLAMRGEGRAAHAPQVALFQDLQDRIAQADPLLPQVGVGIGLPGVGPTADDVIVRPAAVGIDLPLRCGSRRFLVGQRLPAERGTRGSPMRPKTSPPGRRMGGPGVPLSRGGLHEGFQFRLRLVPIDLIVDGDGRCPVASAEAGDALHGDLAGGLPAHLFEIPAEGLAARKVACHVAADLDFGRGRRLQLVVREEARHFVQAVQRLADPLREGPELVLRQVAVLVLDLMEFLDDHERTRVETTRFLFAVSMSTSFTIRASRVGSTHLEFFFAQRSCRVSGLGAAARQRRRAVMVAVALDAVEPRPPGGRGPRS